MYNKINIRKILFPNNIKGVDLISLLSDNSTWPIDPNSTCCSTTPIGFIMAEMPLLADLTIYFPFSIDLKILCEKCCLGPMEFPNQPSSEILII